MSQINTILERLATIQTAITITGGTIGNAYAYWPADPSSAMCPFFVNRVRGGPTQFQATGGMQSAETDIDMVLAVARQESDATFAQVQNHCYLWRDAVFTAMAQKLRLGNDLSYILDAAITNWSIEPQYEVGTGVYVALVFTLQVREWFPLTILP